MADRKHSPNGQDGNHDPFRDYVMKALDELMKFAERSERRWKEEERRWDEERRLRREEQAHFIAAIHKMEPDKQNTT